MNTCTFFGHRQCSGEIKPHLQQTIIDLIKNHNVDTFYVGNQGNFDKIVISVLTELAKQYDYIHYHIVLAYLPSQQVSASECCNTVYPEGIETVPKRFAISWRNKWMIQKSDYVITYIVYSWGGAAKFAELSKRAGKTVINIAQPQ